MGLKDIAFAFWNKNKAGAPKEASPSGAAITPANIKQFVVKAISLAAGTNRGDFETPEWDLAEIKDAINADSYIKIAMTKYKQLILKAGYVIKGQNDAAAEYIRTRLRVISFATGIPFEILIQETGDDLIEYSNSFWIKARVDSVAGGVQAKGALAQKPVGGYFRADPATIQIKRDKNGNVTGYKQKSGSDEKTFKPEDVVHFYIDRAAGAAYGTPRLVAALEDVKLLRKIEGSVISLIYRFAIPIYQWVIGLTQPGFQATSKEIDEAKTEIEKMPLDGIFVTNERTQIKTIGAEGQALDATGYLNYFEKRVFAALNVSESQIGRGGAKQDADSMEQQAHDTVKYVQRIISVIVENSVINELLLEGGYNPIFNEADRVDFEFSEINLETKIKKENHEMTKFQGNIIPFEEVRNNIGTRSDNVDEMRLYKNMVENKAVLEQIDRKTEGSIELAKISAEQSAVSASNSQTKSVGTGAKNTITSRNKPTNQHGTTSAKVKEMTESSSKTQQNVDIYQKKFAKTYNKYKTARNDIGRCKTDIGIIVPLAKDAIVKELKVAVQQSVSEGINKSLTDNGPGVRTQRVSDSIFDEKIESTVRGILKDVSEKIKNGTDIDAAFDSCEYRLRFLSDHVCKKAYWYGYVKACSAAGIETVYIDASENETDEAKNRPINTSNFTLDQIPSFHAYCNCKITLKKAG